MGLDTQRMIREIGNDTIEMLIEKNDSYGDSALNPLGIFGNKDAVTSLGARIDDKLARIRTLGYEGFGEDNVRDLIGYLILLQVELKKRKSSGDAA
tara:strand:+ start:533 stop:820 length:288 start_codon:yes stop_codon:yes gene_type:complete